MAKELPYFKFEPSEWLEGEIQICSDTAIVCFTNLCSGYWLKLGCISYAFALHKYCRKDNDVLQELINNNIIEVINDKICIHFLDNQLEEFKEVSIKRSAAANNRWKNSIDNKVSNANGMQLHNKSNAIREDKIIEDNKILEKSLLSEIKISDDKKFFLIKDLQVEVETTDIEYFNIAEKFRKLFIKNLKEKKSPITHQEKANYKNYVNPIRLLLENKEATKEQLREAYSFLNSVEGEFWKSNILSTAALRKQISTLIAKKNIVKVLPLQNQNVPDHKKRNQL
jgi:hypothetical protein